MNFRTSIRAALSYCCPCCLPPLPIGDKSTELTTICQAPTAPEPMHVPSHLGPQQKEAETDIDVQFSIEGSDDLEFASSPTSNIVPVQLTTPFKPKTTKRYRQTIALLEEFHVTYELIREIYEGIPHHSQYWYEVMAFYLKAKSFVNEGSDKHFYYKDNSNTATDADFDSVKIAMDELLGEWEEIRGLLEKEGVIGRMGFGEDWEVEAVPRSFV